MGTTRIVHMGTIAILGTILKLALCLSGCHSPWVQLELYPWVQLELYLWVQRAPCARRAQRSISKNLTHDRCNARLRTPTQKRRLRTPAQKRRLRTPAQKRRLRTPAQKRRTTTPTQKVFCLLGPKPCKNCESRMSEANPRQSLVKGERLIRYELASAITTKKRSCAKRTFTWGQRSGRKSAANGWTWSKTTGVSQNTQRQSTTTRRPATWLNETTHNRNRINKRKNYSNTPTQKIKSVNYIDDVTSPM